MRPHSPGADGAAPEPRAGAGASIGGTRRQEGRHRWQFWRSPAGQPIWARPVLLALASVAVLVYTWGRGAASLETYYGAAVRSMSQSWRNFFFGAFDPWGTITLDKLPGAFWLQALAVRAGGFHPWVVALPQAIEGGLTVLVLFRAVRRVAGAGAGVAAAAVLVASPAVILLDRGNVPDTLLILLLVLAADATTAAFVTGRTGCLLTAGLWVGLAFQAKMLEAWTVLPALSIAYLLAAPAAPLARRMGHTALFLLAALAVSLSYMAVVTAVPPQDRPYVDGSCNNSIVSQVFQYNGLDRSAGSALDRPGCNPTPAPTAGGPGGQSARSAPLPRGPARFLTGGLAREIDWMLVPALVSFAGVVMLRRREPRTDPVRASAVLWGGWLFFMWSSFASSHHLNDYYFAALGPPIAALCALGISSAWRTRHRRGTLLIVGGTVVAGTAYALALVPSNAGVRPWVLTTSLLLALLASTSLAWSLTSRPRWLPGVGVMLAAGALLAGSAWASGTAAVAGLGPFDAPYQPEAVTQQEHTARGEGGGAGTGPCGGGVTRTSWGVGDHRRDLGRLSPGRLRDRPGVPPRGRLHRKGTEPHAASVPRGRAPGEGHHRPGGRCSRDPQPRLVVGGVALPAPADHGSGQPHRGPVDELLPVHVRRRDPGEAKGTGGYSDVEEAADGDGRADGPDGHAHEDHHDVGQQHLGAGHVHRA